LCDIAIFQHPSPIEVESLKVSAHAKTHKNYRFNEFTNVENICDLIFAAEKVQAEIPINCRQQQTWTQNRVVKPLKQVNILRQNKSRNKAEVHR